MGKKLTPPKVHQEPSTDPVTAPVNEVQLLLMEGIGENSNDKYVDEQIALQF